MEEMDSKPYQPLSKGRHEMEMSYTSSSDESEDGRPALQQSYTSRETLPDYTHELRLTLGAHRDRQSNYSQQQPGKPHEQAHTHTHTHSRIPAETHVCADTDTREGAHTH